MSNSIILPASVMIAVSFATGAVAENSNAFEPPMDLLAAQIRDQGFTCNKPQSAKYDAERSKPNEKVWILTCENDTFRMTVIPNMAAKIEKLD